MLQKNGEKLRIDCLPNWDRWKTNEERDNCQDEKNNNFCFENIHLYFFTGQIIFYCRKILNLNTQLIRRLQTVAITQISQDIQLAIFLWLLGKYEKYRKVLAPPSYHGYWRMRNLWHSFAVIYYLPSFYDKSFNYNRVYDKLCCFHIFLVFCYLSFPVSNRCNTCEAQLLTVSQLCIHNFLAPQIMFTCRWCHKNSVFFCRWVARAVTL